jgi:hypothetical protein
MSIPLRLADDSSWPLSVFFSRSLANSARRLACSAISDSSALLLLRLPPASDSDSDSVVVGRPCRLRCVVAHCALRSSPP